MIIVIAGIEARPESFEELLALCLAHVKRSRMEPGCRSHAVYRDPENLLRLVFVEEWDDRAALAAHFAVAGSRAFVNAAGRLSIGEPVLNIFEASPAHV